jgi:2-polyprenyl-3-methyl-5-hydroxy-6-metoxy-1,4-benzoquinol methylase
MRECFVCNSLKDLKYYCTVDGFDHIRCANCQLIYVESIAESEELYRSYDGGSFKSFRRKLMAPFRSFTSLKNFKYNIDRANRIFDYSLKYFTGNSEKPTLLDIGCNKGFLLSVAADNNWDIYGVEIVPELIIPFKKKYREFREQIYSGGFEDNYSRFREGMFDTITAIDVIEHFEDPVGDMSRIYEILKPGGNFLIQTPDGDCQQAKELKEKWGALKPLQHLQIFSRKNLEIFSKQLGYKSIEFSEPFEDADGNFVAVMTK